MPRSSTRHHINFESKLNEIYFQNIRTPDSNRSPTNYFGRKSYTGHDHEKLFESYTLVLWVKQFCGAGNSLKNTNKCQTTSLLHPTHLDPRSPDNGDINKINLHTGKIGTSKKK